MSVTLTPMDEVAEAIGEFVTALVGRSEDCPPFRTDADEVERYFLPLLKERGLDITPAMETKQ